MNNTLFSDSNLTELQGFMFDTMASADMAVDWFCERFDVSATDEVIDFVVDTHFAFFGEWQSASRLIHSFLNISDELHSQTTATKS